MWDDAEGPEREASSNRSGLLVHVVRMHVDRPAYTMGRGLAGLNLY